MAFNENINKSCLKCEYCIPEVNSCCRDSCIHEPSWLLEEKKTKSHKCYGCVWGTRTGDGFFCMLPKCKPNLHKFGVDK